MTAETLICNIGDHEWTRERKRGPKPPRCPEHAAEHRAARQAQINADWRRKYPHYHTEYRRTYRDSGREASLARARGAERRAAGICTKCSEPLAEGSTWLCERHKSIADERRSRNASRARVAIVADHLDALDVAGCYLCERPLDDDETWHIEHVVPVAHGGDEWVRVACADCNLTKGARFPGEVIEELHPEGDAIADALESGVFTLVDATTGEVLSPARCPRSPHA